MLTLRHVCVAVGGQCWSVCEAAVSDSSGSVSTCSGPSDYITVHTPNSSSSGVHLPNSPTSVFGWPTSLFVLSLT